MEPIYLSIQQKETGSRIKSLLRESGYTVRDIQNAMGFENPQAVYKWISGKCLPSLDNFLILSRLLNTSIEDILVIDGDIPRFRSKYREIREKLSAFSSAKADSVMKAFSGYSGTVIEEYRLLALISKGGHSFKRVKNRMEILAYYINNFDNREQSSGIILVEETDE